jgi:ubiquinone/menaquinone biosynthesis C-methylase UbiE
VSAREARDVCSAEHAGWLTTPVRRLVTNPQRILGALVASGDIAADLGCGPGFFTLPLAEMVGDDGRVIAVDLQQAMLDRLRDRAVRAGLLERIRLHRCAAESLGLAGDVADGDTAGLAGHVDFALAFWMVHEVPDASRLLAEVREALRPGGRLLVVEPKGHVGAADWERTLASAAVVGLALVRPLRLAFSRAALLERPADA